MQGSTIERAERETEFVLVGIGDFVAFLTRYHFQMSINYFYAVQNATTWEDFRVICGPDLFGYVSMFLHSSGPIPEDSDLIADLWDDLWVLNDPDFPVANFLEETTTFHGKKFPTDLIARQADTEYGLTIDLYPPEKSQAILDRAQSGGYALDRVDLSFA